MPARCAGWLVALGLIVTIGASAVAEIRATWEVNRQETATAEFPFEKIAPPSATDAANRGTFTLLDGRADPGGGDLRTLHDGQLPRNHDDPPRNFFFSPGTRRGRLLLDLGQATPIEQINTYSWHRSSRGPQVYRLYAKTAADDEPLELQDDQEPVESGWKLLAEVDTRAEGQPPGGQYAVSIADSEARVLGSYRYLLWEILPTNEQNRFGNTFFSEIDVLDGQSHPPPPPPEGLEVVELADGTEIVLDTRELPEIRRWVNERLKPICTEWYPKIVEMLPSEGYTAPRSFTIIFRKQMDGVAYAQGDTIHCAGPWFLRNLQGEAAGAVVHEMVHVVQQYGRSRRGNRNPSWMVEGVADYIRWFLYEPAENRPRVNARRANYDDSYRTTAAFLNYVMEHHNGEIVKRFNADMRQGDYRQELWEKYTGKPVEELWAAFVETLGD